MIKKYNYLGITKKDLKLSRIHAIRLCSMGIPMGLQYSITAIGSVILQSAVNVLGETYMAAVTAGSKVSMFMCCPFDAMGSTTATYGGQNVGAGKLDRVDRGIKDCIKLGLIYSVIALVAILLFGKQFALLFVKKDNMQLIDYIYKFNVANAAFYFPLALVNIVRFMIQGLGFSAFAVIAGICEMFARSIAGFVLVPVFGYNAVVFANPLAWIFADIFLIPAYLYVMKRLRQKIRNY